MNSLRRIDLNLLVTLEALLDEQHVSRAALRLHKSQPAVSHDLARLREIFDDPLLIRDAGKMRLTLRAEQLIHPLSAALTQLNAVLTPESFEPALTHRLFRLAMSDYGAQAILPELILRLQSTAPGIDIQVSQASRDTMMAQVIDGELDLAFGVFPEPDTEIRSQTIFTESFVCLADRHRIAEPARLDLDGWLSYPHVLVATPDAVKNEIDTTLAGLGRQRHIKVVLPHWGVASEMIIDTELILTVASKSVAEAAKNPRLAVFAPPFDIPCFGFEQIWHRRRDADPAHRWLREVIFQIASGERP